MKDQVLFFSKDKSKKLKCRLLQFLFGALRVKAYTVQHRNSIIFTSLGYFLVTQLQEALIVNISILS